MLAISWRLSKLVQEGLKVDSKLRSNWDRWGNKTSANHRHQHQVICTAHFRLASIFYLFLSANSDLQSLPNLFHSLYGFIVMFYLIWGAEWSLIQTFRPLENNEVKLSHLGVQQAWVWAYHCVTMDKLPKHATAMLSTIGATSHI